MKKIVILIMVGYVFTSFHSSSEEIKANEEESRGMFEVGFIIGNTDLSIDKTLSVSQKSESFRAVTLGMEFGYQWLSNYVVSTAYNVTNNFSFGLSDDYTLFQNNILVGYSIDLSNNFRLIPMIGFNRWRLYTEEAKLFNPGSEEENKFGNTDFTYQVGLEIPVLNDLTFDLSYENTKFSFGKVEMTTLGFSYEF